LKSKIKVPDFDDVAPWGTYRLKGGKAALLMLSHRLPKQLSWLTKPLRRWVKHHHTQPLDIEVWDFRLRMLPRGNMSEQKLYTAPQFFDINERAVLTRLLQPGSVFVDVGANAGIYSFWANKCMDGDGRIIAVEPDPEMARRIRFNIKNNNLKSIELQCVALSDHEGTAELLINPQQRGTNTLEKEEIGKSKGARVPTTVELTTLATLCSKLGLSKIYVLKIDIEGHEIPVLTHFLTTARSELWPKAIISEFKEQTSKGIVDLLIFARIRGHLQVRFELHF
jgi:FkbM family methyltransferase